MPNPHGYNTLLSGHKESLVASLHSDGTTTIYEILDPEGRVAATGVAKRRKGDARNPEVGVALAASRAHADLAEQFAAAADHFAENPE